MGGIARVAAEKIMGTGGGAGIITIKGIAARGMSKGGVIKG